jgi:Asp-tRNA(Asn)/Glu-tRNA(Gln) amidotransferase A subunit family amidase
MDRRQLLGAGLASAAAATQAKAEPTAAAPAPAAAPITEQTLAEAEKLSAVSFPPDSLPRLVGPVQAGVAGVEAIRATPHPLDLQPAWRFDPRMPGKAYPAQANRLVLSDDTTPAPKADADLAFAGAAEQARWIGSGQVTSERLTRIYLDRIGRLDGRLHAWITVIGDQALATARERDAEVKAGRIRGPLHGVPYALKDVIDTKGIRTTWGSSLYKDRVPDEDATIAVMLREAGAVLLGKLGTGELANGAAWYGGEVRNPWNPDEPAGGSSSGPGSAVAAGLCAFAIGTDSLGSILNPADRCGVTGLRPTFGRVPVHGGMPLTPSLERIGPLCRRVEDAALVLSVINGPDPTSINSIDMGFDYDAAREVKGLRVGWSPSWFKTVGFGGEDLVPVCPAHLHALDVARGLGVELVEIELPPLPYAALLPNLYVESAAVFEELTLDGRDARLIAPWADLWRQAHFMSAVDYLQAERFRRQVMQVMDTVFDKVDLLLAPTYGDFTLFMICNFTGHPGLTFRCGFSETPTRTLSVKPADPDGPRHRVTCNISMHGRLFGEGTMLELARRMEAAMDVWPDRPPMAA